MIFTIILTFAYHDGPVTVEDNYLKKFIKVKKRQTVNAYVQSLEAKGCIDIVHPDINEPGIRHITLVKKRTPKGYGKPLRKVVPMKTNFGNRGV